MDKDSPLMLISNAELSKSACEIIHLNQCYKTTQQKEEYAISTLNVLVR